MKIGFTGTRHGMTDRQFANVAQLLCASDIVEFHHGDCIGADADAHSLVECKAKDGLIKLVIHPPVDETHRAFCKNATEVREPKTHFARNRDIVDDCDFLIATPYAVYEESHGGTWYTVNYARKKSKWLAIMWPDGRIQFENEPK